MAVLKQHLSVSITEERSVLLVAFLITSTLLLNGKNLFSALTVLLQNFARFLERLLLLKAGVPFS